MLLAEITMYNIIIADSDRGDGTTGDTEDGCVSRWIGGRRERQCGV